MAVKVVECLSWSAPDKPGTLLRYATALASRRVNLDALWAYPGARGGRIAAIGKNAAQLRSAAKAMGIRPEASKVFYLSGKDKAGVLVDALHALSLAGINVECADAVAGQGKFGATLWVKAKDFAKAKRALRA